jgi:hypothetical protein
VKLDATDIQDLAPLIRAAVVATLDEMRATEAKLGDRLAFTESEAAGLLGVPRHVLRDARLRGEISARTCGKKLLYSRESLLRFVDPRA